MNKINNAINQYNKKLSYNECKDIYRATVMGKRVVEGLINFAMSVDREITIQNAPQEAVDEFIKVSKKMKQDENIKKTLYNSRIFGTGALLVNALKKETTEDGNIIVKPDFRLKPTFDTINDYDIYFITLDTQNISNAKIDTDILSPTFLQLIDISINGHKIDNRFIAISHAIDMLYQDDRTDMIPYAPPSVFYNMIDLLNDYDKAIRGLDALLYKSGCFIYQYPAKSKISGATFDAIKTSNYILEQKSNGSVISIQRDADIKDFPLSNINGLIEAINKLEDAITKALNDTPASILFDRKFTGGFGDGDNDKATEVQTVNTFRQNKMKPLYDLTDYYVMLCAWNNDFINEMKDKYNDLNKYTNIQLFKKWQDDFVFEFGNLYPEPENIKIENNSKKLDNLLKLMQLGANKSDIEAELNEDRIFKNDIDLDGEPQQFGNDNDNGEDTQIDYNLYKNIYGNNKKLNKYIDSIIRNDDYIENIKVDEEPPPGHEWKTLKSNGEHVLVNSESGEVVSGAGGALSKDKQEAKKANKENKENKENNSSNDNNSSNNNSSKNNSSKKTITNKEYLRNKKFIKAREDLIGFHKRELENLHPNDKMNRKAKEEEIEFLENEKDYIQAKQDNEEYEKNNKKVNAEKDKPAKDKKIGKTYKIAYDKETIEKLNSIGKNWKDKRIYFKELGNGYYDLENEKWVTDSPELTKKAIEIAGETAEEKTARLENERIEKEKREEEKRIEKKKQEENERIEKEKREAKLEEFNKKTREKIYDKGGWKTKEFKKQIGKAMYQIGIFDDGFIGKGSINKIKSKLFTDEEIKNWDEVNSISINDIVYSAVKGELNNIQNMYKPLKWGDWLWQEKDLNNGSQSVNDIEDFVGGDPDLIREELNFKYINNSTAWEKFGEEFNQYKKDYQKEASQKIKDYIKENYADSKIYVDSKDNDYKSDSEIDNDIEYYIDNLIKYVDLKNITVDEEPPAGYEWKTLKSNGEHVLVNSETGEVVSGAGGALSKDKNKKTNSSKKSNDKSKKTNSSKKSKDKSKDNLDYGDLPAELHEPFKRLNTTQKPSQYIFNNNNKYGLTIDKIEKASKKLKDEDKVFFNLHKFEIKDEDGDVIEEVDLTNSDALQSDHEKFLYDFTKNSDNAKEEWGDKWEDEIKPQLKQMIKNSPVMKGRAYRGEVDIGRFELEEGGKVDFDCRSVSDDGEGFEVAMGFMQGDYENGEDVIIFVFPEDTKGLNIKGCSVYPNEHEYLVDGDFIIESIDEDEFGIKHVYLQHPEE